jgi:hypothetical protein
MRKKNIPEVELKEVCGEIDKFISFQLDYYIGSVKTSAIRESLVDMKELLLHEQKNMVKSVIVDELREEVGANG